MSEKFYRLGCDIGGTFTDFVLLNDQTGELKINKCLTTPKDPSDAVEQGIRELEEKVKAKRDAISELEAKVKSLEKKLDEPPKQKAPPEQQTQQTEEMVVMEPELAPEQESTPEQKDQKKNEDSSKTL